MFPCPIPLRRVAVISLLLPLVLRSNHAAHAVAAAKPDIANSR